jgi:hypothetical protein
MSKLTLRGGAAALALAALAAPSAATAAPVKITDGTFVDTSSDGRYVLTATTIIDRATGTDWAIGGSAPAIALADHSRRVLVDYGTSLGGFNPDSSSPKTFAFAVPTVVDGKDAQPGHAEFVKNGTVVIFDTKESTPRIISYDITTNETTVLMTGATLTDASEDGQVIGFRKELPNLTAPSNVAPITFGGPVIGASAVGYLVAGQAPRVVATSSWKHEYRPGNDTGECSSRIADLTGETPTGLRISQDGTGRYALYVTKAVVGPGDALRQGHGVVERITLDGSTTIADAAIPPNRIDFTNDPVSGAYGTINTPKTTIPPVNTAGVTADDGTLRATGVLPVDGPGGTWDDSAYYTGIVPVNAGAAAIYTGYPRTRDASLSRPTTFVNEGAAVGASTTPWLSLPRTGDAPLTAATKGTATWALCDDAPAVGTIGDYAAIALTPTGNSAGKVTVTLAPDGFVAAKAAQLKITWFGIPVWSKTIRTSGTVALPSIPARIGGFKLTVAVVPADGSATLSQSTALRRTR